jgi:hypothetical protein
LELLDDEEFLSRRRGIELERAATEERLGDMEKAGSWFEPAELLISFRSRAISWFRRGTDEIRRLILVTVGSNYRLTNKEVSGEARKPFTLWVKEPVSLYWCGVGDDVRTRFELLQHDPEFIEIINNIKKLKAMVEEEGCMEAPLLLEVCERESSTDEEVAQDVV